MVVLVVLVMVGLRTHLEFRTRIKPEGRAGEKWSRTRPIGWKKERQQGRKTEELRSRRAKQTSGDKKADKQRYIAKQKQVESDKQTTA